MQEESLKADEGAQLRTHIWTYKDTNLQMTNTDSELWQRVSKSKNGVNSLLEAKWSSPG